MRLTDAEKSLIWRVHNEAEAYRRDTTSLWECIEHICETHQEEQPDPALTLADAQARDLALAFGMEEGSITPSVIISQAQAMQHSLSKALEKNRLLEQEKGQAAALLIDIYQQIKRYFGED